MKKLGLILIAVALCVSLITSCAPENEIDEVVDMKFDVSRTITRGLSASIEEFNSEDLYWKYTAVKADGTNYTTGQQETPVWLKETTDGKGDKGTSKKSLTLSVGTWQFALYGYKDSDGKQLAYQTNIPKQVTIENNSKATIVVSVSPVQTEEGKGTIVVSTELLKDASKGDVIVKLSLVENENPSKWDDRTKDATFYGVKSGNYSASIEIADKNNDKVIYVNDGININVYDYLTTYITGTPISNTQEAEITVNREQGTTTAVGTSTISSGSDSTIKAAVSASSAQGGYTTITYPSGALSDGEAKTTIIAYDSSAVKDENNKPSFSITTNNSVLLGGLDLTVELNNAKVTSFNNLVTVSTFIGKGMDSNVVSVIYDSGSENGKTVENAEYNSETGIVTFKTRHFSRYYILAEGVVAVSTNGYASSDLNMVAMNSSQDGTIYLLRNIDYTSSDVKFGIIDTLYGTLDGNGYTVTLPEGKFFICYMDENATLKNLNAKITNCPVVYWAFFNPTFEDVTVEGEIKILDKIDERNNGAFVCYVNYGCTFNNCIADVEMNYPANYNNYNAVFVGSAFTPSGETAPQDTLYSFNNCTMKKSITSGRSSIFIGNVYQMSNGLTLNISNFQVEGESKLYWTNSTELDKFNGLIAQYANKAEIKVKINGEDCTAIGQKGQDSSKNNYSICEGLLVEGINKINLSATIDNDKKLQISAGNSANITKVIITSSTYVKYTTNSGTNGTDVVYVSQTFNNIPNDYTVYPFMDSATDGVNSLTGDDIKTKGIAGLKDNSYILAEKIDKEIISFDTADTAYYGTINIQAYNGNELLASIHLKTN